MTVLHCDTQRCTNSAWMQPCASSRVRSALTRSCQRSIFRPSICRQPRSTNVDAVRFVFFPASSPFTSKHVNSDAQQWAAKLSQHELHRGGLASARPPVRHQPNQVDLVRQVHQYSDAIASGAAIWEFGTAIRGVQRPTTAAHMHPLGLQQEQLGESNSQKARGAFLHRGQVIAQGRRTYLPAQPPAGGQGGERVNGRAQAQLLALAQETTYQSHLHVSSVGTWP